MKKDIEEIVQIVGRNTLSEYEQMTLDIAKMTREDFLQQNRYPDHDPYCPSTRLRRC